MKHLILIIMFLCLGCNAQKQEVVQTNKEKAVNYTPPTISKEFVDNSTYWCLPQYFNGVPKYCAFGTYTHKHIPLAFKANNDIYHVYTDNTQDDNFYVYAAKNNTERVLVHTIENWEDPHTNAIIHVLKNGIVHVHVASRGIKERNSFQSGKILASKTPYELDFECIDGCESDNNEGYPQVWDTTWGEHVNFSKNMFEYDLHDKQWMRSPHYRLNGEVKQIVRGGHYYISYYDSTNHVMYLVYNLLVDGHPDSRINLYAIKTIDGINWTNIDGKALTLPLEPDSDDTRIFKSIGYTYLKDLSFDGELSVLFVESNSADPTQGVRYMKEWRNNKPIRSITPVGHNYDAGAYIGNNIVLSKDGVSGWIGGDLVLYQDYREIDRDDNLNCAYVRKVINSRDKAVASCNDFHNSDKAEHYILTIQ